MVLVLNNQDLAEVSWEQREMEGDSRFPPSQQVPLFPFAEYARLLGLGGVRLDKNEDIDQAWRDALTAEKPVVIEAIVDRDIPLLPPRASLEKWHTMRDALRREEADNAVHALDEQREQEDKHPR